MPALTIRSSAGAAAGGCLARLFPSAIALVFVGLGSWFTLLGGRSLMASLSVYGWERGECAIVASAVEERPDDPGGEQFVFTVTYRYQAAGEDWVGSRVRPGYVGSGDPRPAQLLLERYPPGARVGCWIDPDDPAAAALERPSPWSGLFILFPLVFVAVGAGVLLAVWWPWGRARRREAGREGEAAGSPPVSRRVSTGATGAGLGCLVAFFALFLLAGLGVLWFAGLRPASRAWAAREWRETPCRILKSEVGEHRGDDSTTYSVDVLYAYAVDGRQYKSSRYDFLGGSSSGYEGKAAVVERLPAGTETVCWVDPADPTSAVVERGFHKGYLVGLFGLPFLLAGAGGIVFTVRGWRRSRRGRDPRPPGLAVAASAGPVTLRPRATPLGKFVGLTFAATFWNGITGLFVWQAVQGWRSGAGDGCLTVFLVPFVLVGVALLMSVPYQLLTLLNPRPVLTLERGEITPGEALQLSWRFRGLAGRIARLRLSLEGREEATYRRGDSSATDKETFADVTLLDSTQPLEIAAGATRLELPAGAMHTFVAAHNKILWSLKVSGAIARWPDVAEEFEVVVRPPEVGR